MAFPSYRPGARERRRRTGGTGTFAGGLRNYRARTGNRPTNRAQTSPPRQPAARTGAPARPAAGAGPAAGAATAPAPQRRVGQKPEFDEPYFRQVGAAERQGAERLSELEGEKGRVEHEFGFTDPTNAFSRASTLKKAYLARRKAASASLASAGQLYSGAHERALTRTRTQEEQAYNELRNAYMASIGNLSEKERETKYATEEQKEQAFRDWLERAPEADEPLDEEPAAEEAGGEAEDNEKPKPEAATSDSFVARTVGGAPGQSAKKAGRERDRAYGLRGKNKKPKPTNAPKGKSPKPYQKPTGKARKRQTDRWARGR